MKRGVLTGKRTGFESKDVLSSSRNYFLDLSLDFFICKIDDIYFTTLWEAEMR